MSSYLISPEAENDLTEILDYIAQDHLETAWKALREIESKMNALAENPMIGHLREDLVDEPLRFLSVYSYLIIYKFEKSPIEIVRVLHGGRDVTNIFDYS